MSNIQNPFLSGNKLLLPIDTSFVEINETNASKYFKEVYILVKKSDNRLPIDFFKKFINEETLQQMKQELVIWKASLSIIKNKNNFEKLSIINQKNLQDFNQFSLDINENNLVLSIFNISFKNIINYLNNTNGISNVDQIYNYLVISNYLKDDLSNIKNKNHFESLLKNIEESTYWTLSYNCLTNLTKAFKYRRFNNIFRKLLKTDSDTKSENNKGNYLEFVMKTKKYVDASSFSGFKNYHSMNNTTYSRDDINNLFLSLDDKNKYFLFCNLIVSKEYTHLVMNNLFILDLMEKVIKEDSHLFRYLMGYAWLKFYFEESTKKSKLTIKDDCIFNIHTASKLPVFPFHHKFPKLNPYMPIMVDDKILNSEFNINGLINYKFNEMYKDYYNQGICNFDEFKRRFNLFATGNPKVDLFQGIEWEKDKIAISGSIMTACLQNVHPLMNMFHEKIFDEKLIRFFNEFYPLSDIDIMFLTNNVFQFMDRVQDFHNQMVVNVCSIYPAYAEPDHIKLIPSFQIHFFVKDSWIKRHIVNENITFDFIFTNIEEKAIQDLFKPFFKDELKKFVEHSVADKNEEDILLCKNTYSSYFQSYEDYNIKIKIIHTKDKRNMNKEDTSMNKEDTSINKEDTSMNKDSDTNDKDNDSINKDSDTIDKDNDSINKERYTNNKERKDIEIKINYKFKIKSPHLNHQLELFMSKGEDHMNLVSQFHLPCVRAVYTGDNVYMTPSCIFANMTYMNIDYKYFAGSKDPIDIINKNRMRGFGTWLNENEIDNFVKYSSEVDWWTGLYGINKNSNEKNHIRGSQTLSHTLFHPRLINADYFYDAPPIDIENGYKDNYQGENIITRNDAMEELNKIYNTKSDFITSNLQVINSDGSINPLQKWVIEGYYETKHNTK